MAMPQKFLPHVDPILIFSQALPAAPSYLQNHHLEMAPRHTGERIQVRNPWRGDGAHRANQKLTTALMLLRAEIYPNSRSNLRSVDI
jgi:hypothetical protein